MVCSGRFWQNSDPVLNAPSDEAAAPPTDVVPASAASRAVPPKPSDRIEIGGPAGPEPTRFGDWEKNGRCVDF